MPKQIAFSKSIPLPSMVTRELALALLHNHGEMIDLNPTVIAHRQIQTPRGVNSSETFGYDWHELSEDISYLSAGSFRSVATYKACYRDLDNGVDLHIYGPQGLDVKEQWTITDSSVDDPESSGCLWLRRNCNVTSLTALAPTTEKNLYLAHQLFEERVIEKCLPQRHPSRPRHPFARTSSLRFSRLSSRSSIVSEPDDFDYKRSSIGSLLDPSDTHPAFRNDVDWSLVSEADSNNHSQRTASLTSRSSTYRSNTLRRRPNIYNRNERSSEGSSVGSSYVESLQSNSSPERCGSSSTYYSTTTSLPGSSIPEESDEDRAPKPEPAAYDDMGGNPFTLESPKSHSSSIGSSTPSLVEESSDDETSIQTEELQTPVDSADAAKIFEEMQLKFFASLPPPLPERAEGHTVPAPLSVRPQSTVSMYEGRTRYPHGYVPSRTSSMKRGTSHSRTRKPSKMADPELSIGTDETERMLSLSYGNGFSVYGC